MLRICPAKQIYAEFSLNGDKSMAQRAILLAAAIHGKFYITGVDFSLDVKAAITCAKTLGACVEEVENALIINGTDKGENGKTFDCGNSATTMRLLTGILVGKNLRATLIGDSSLTKRPMQRIAEPLNSLGGKVETTRGYAPIEVYPSDFKGGKITMTVPSAQVKSGVLLAGAFSGKEIILIEKVKTRDHTEKMLRAMGADISQIENNAEGRYAITLKKSSFHALNVEIPCDISSAAYFLALGALKGQAVCRNIGLNPTRTGILKTFDQLGIKYSISHQRQIHGEAVGDIVAEKSLLRAAVIPKEDISAMIDEIPIIALLCAFARGESRIYGLKELTIKESNRLLEIVNLITAFGGECKAEDDSLIIVGKGYLKGGNYSSDDHRMVMTAAIAAACAQYGGEIGDEKVVSVSFPDFFKELSKGVSYYEVKNV